jgi:phosphomannomutase
VDLAAKRDGAGEAPGDVKAGPASLHVWGSGPLDLTPEPRMIVFDLDDTLTLTKSVVSAEMADLLVRLIAARPVCVISGSRFEQFELQILDSLPASPELLTNLHLMPTCGTRYYRWMTSHWQQVYSEDLSEPERTAAKEVLKEAAHTLGYWEPRIWGERIEDRGSQVTFSALGQVAPPELKAKWDPSGAKKSAMREYVAERLPGLEVRSGGTTSIDITKKGVDKAFGLRKLIKATGLPPGEVLFVGDSFAEHGNDYPAIGVGVRCVAVANHTETEDLIEYILKSLCESSGARS